MMRIFNNKTQHHIGFILWRVYLLHLVYTGSSAFLMCTKRKADGCKNESVLKMPTGTRVHFALHRPLRFAEPASFPRSRYYLTLRLITGPGPGD